VARTAREDFVKAGREIHPIFRFVQYWLKSEHAIDFPTFSGQIRLNACKGRVKRNNFIFNYLEYLIFYNNMALCLQICKYQFLF